MSKKVHYPVFTYLNPFGSGVIIFPYNANKHDFCYIPSEKIKYIDRKKIVHQYIERQIVERLKSEKTVPVPVCESAALQEIQAFGFSRFNIPYTVGVLNHCLLQYVEINLDKCKRKAKKELQAIIESMKYI